MSDSDLRLLRQIVRPPLARTADPDDPLLAPSRPQDGPWDTRPIVWALAIMAAVAAVSGAPEGVFWGLIGMAVGIAFGGLIQWMAGR